MGRLGVLGSFWIESRDDDEGDVNSEYESRVEAAEPTLARACVCELERREGVEGGDARTEGWAVGGGAAEGGAGMKEDEAPLCVSWLLLGLLLLLLLRWWCWVLLLLLRELLVVELRVAVVVVALLCDETADERCVPGCWSEGMAREGDDNNEDGRDKAKGRSAAMAATAAAADAPPLPPSAASPPELLSGIEESRS